MIFISWNVLFPVIVTYFFYSLFSNYFYRSNDQSCEKKVLNDQNSGSSSSSDEDSNEEKDDFSESTDITTDDEELRCEKNEKLSESSEIPKNYYSESGHLSEKDDDAILEEVMAFKEKWGTHRRDHAYFRESALQQAWAHPNGGHQEGSPYHYDRKYDGAKPPNRHEYSDYY